VWNVCALPSPPHPFAMQVAIGDTVVVAGTVAEFAGLTELTTITAVRKCGCGLLPFCLEITLAIRVSCWRKLYRTGFSSELAMFYSKL